MTIDSVPCPVCDKDHRVKPNKFGTGYWGRCSCSKVRLFIDDGTKAEAMSV